MKQPVDKKLPIRRDLAIKILHAGGVGILPTDTLYGIVGSALSREAVERIYRLRRRNPKKPTIILISSIDDLGQFGIKPTPAIKKHLKRIWPAQVSIVLPVLGVRSRVQKLEYLHRGTKTLAFRLPAETLMKTKTGEPFRLREFLKKAGPLVAPSANFEGEPSAKTIRAAKKYFGDNVDFYLDVGKLDSKPSTVIKIERGKITVLREGVVKI